LKTLIVEDDFPSGAILQRLLAPYGPAQVAVSGFEALRAFEAAWAANEPYQLICLDVELSLEVAGPSPLDGREVLRRIRAAEAERKANRNQTARVVMTTAASEPKSIVSAFSDSCDGYLVKPFHVNRLRELLRSFGFLPPA
jgi:two-component system chemotaxis response regulator CheY